MTGIDFSAYDDAIADIEKDDRVGEHDAVVDYVELGAWPDGSKRYKIQFMLITANMAKADLTLNELPTPEELAAAKETLSRGRAWGMSQQVKTYRVLAQHYDVTDIMKIEKGDTFRVKTYQTKIDPMTGKGGFIKVREILEKEAEIEAPATAPF